jgi:hypothetical protein
MTTIVGATYPATCTVTYGHMRYAGGRHCADRMKSGRNGAFANDLPASPLR